VGEKSNDDTDSFVSTPALQRAVQSAGPSQRELALAGLLAVALVGSGATMWRANQCVPELENDPAPAVWSRVAAARSDAGCTSLEVVSYLARTPLDASERVNCWARAGKVERARAELDGLRGPTRQQAIASLFELAHPIADAGDDQSAGPIMKLLVDVWPDNYMAVFHAGMAEFALGRDGEAEKYLRQFLQMYVAHDVWRHRAKGALENIEAGTAIEKRAAHFCR
jgi:hypothetical protein